MDPTPSPLGGPDLSIGVSLADVSGGGMLLGHAHGEQVLRVRCNGALFAAGASCPHYGGPLVEGLLVDDTVRCPWHRAGFCLNKPEC